MGTRITCDVDRGVDRFDLAILTLASDSGPEMAAGKAFGPDAQIYIGAAVHGAGGIYRGNASSLRHALARWSQGEEDLAVVLRKHRADGDEHVHVSASRVVVLRHYAPEA